jgi:hypothetical protein
MPSDREHPMPRDDWANARTRDIQRSAWKIQQDEEVEKRATGQSLKDVYAKWTKKLQKSKRKSKKQRKARSHVQ